MMFLMTLSIPIFSVSVLPTIARPFGWRWATCNFKDGVATFTPHPIALAGMWINSERVLALRTRHFRSMRSLLCAYRLISCRHQIEFNRVQTCNGQTGFTQRANYALSLVRMCPKFKAMVTFWTRYIFDGHLSFLIFLHSMR